VKTRLFFYANASYIYTTAVFFKGQLELGLLVSFIGGGNRSTRRKPPTCWKSLTNFIT